MARAPLLALLLTTALAGCSAPYREDGGDPTAYILVAAGVPAQAGAGEAFTFRLDVSRGAERTTDHIGAHYWDFDTPDPTADFGRQAGACTHVPGGGTLPGSFNVTCSIATSGTYHLRGHVRFVEANQTHNAWTQGHEIVVE